MASLMAKVINRARGPIFHGQEGLLAYPRMKYIGLIRQLELIVCDRVDHQLRGIQWYDNPTRQTRGLLSEESGLSSSQLLLVSR